MNKKSAYSIIPATIRYAAINPFSKVLWSEIYVQNYAGIVNITIDDLARLFDVNRSTIHRSIVELSQNNFISKIGKGNQTKIEIVPNTSYPNWNKDETETKAIKMSPALIEFFATLEK